MHTTWASNYPTNVIKDTIYPTNVISNYIKDNHKDLTTGILIIFFIVVKMQFYMCILFHSLYFRSIFNVPLKLKSQIFNYLFNQLLSYWRIIKLYQYYKILFHYHKWCWRWIVIDIFKHLLSSE